jgi:hypothetical protein
MMRSCSSPEIQPDGPWRLARGSGVERVGVVIEEPDGLCEGERKHPV